ncbi:hypothetical protein GCM10027456_40100 [Kineosporia babensis]
MKQIDRPPHLLPVDLAAGFDRPLKNAEPVAWCGAIQAIFGTAMINGHPETSPARNPTARLAV